MAEESREGHGDSDHSSWQFPEPESKQEILGPEKAENPIENVLRFGKEKQKERDEEYQKERAERKERIERLSPAEFVGNEIDLWRKRHEGSEFVDTGSPFETLQCLLSLLVEEGADWPPQKAQAVRRIMMDFAKRSFGTMKLDQRRFLVAIDSNPYLGGFEDGGPLEDDDERMLVDNMLKATGANKPMLGN